MEKAKHKQSPALAEQRLTKILFIILGLSIFFFFLPINISFPYIPALDFGFSLSFPYHAISFQSYALVPLTALALGIYFRRYGLSRVHLLLFAACLLIALLIYLRWTPCDNSWQAIYYPIPYLPFVSIYQGCGVFFVGPLF